MKLNAVFEPLYSDQALTPDDYERVWAVWSDMTSGCSRPRKDYLADRALTRELDNAWNFITALPGSWSLARARKASRTLWHAQALNRRPRDTGPVFYDPHLDRLAAAWYMAWLLMYSRARVLRDVDAADKVLAAGPVDFNPVTARILMDKIEGLLLDK